MVKELINGEGDCSIQTNVIVNLDYMFLLFIIYF